MKSFMKIFIIILISFFTNQYSQAGQTRDIISFNDQWHFQGGSASGRQIDQMVDLPHTWNATDAQQGMPYFRGTALYSKTFDVPLSWKNKRIFVRFRGVNITAEVTLNGVDLGTHKGGYAAFCYELTSHLIPGQKNIMEVNVSNESNLEIIPLVGDFNNYGGIYRPVELIITNQVCISPLDYASPGVYVKQQKVHDEQADIEVITEVNNALKSMKLECRTTIFRQDGRVQDTGVASLEVPEKASEVRQKFTIANPHLWNGKADPYLYRVAVELFNDGHQLDSVSQPLGLRYFHIDADSGFYLNGHHLSLHGVSRHQDRQDKGNALSAADHRQDMALILDLGANAIRLAHYQQADLMYHIADSAGLIVWAEIPWVGAPGRFMGTSNGYEKTTAFKTIARQQLTELIRQNYNHPSILMWSIFNEIQNPEDNPPTALIKELYTLAHREDSSRLVVGASMLAPEGNENIHDVTDAIAWNRYFGWYYKMPKDMGDFLDQTHSLFPTYKIGISEYGAGGSINQHTSSLSPPNPFGSPHPEEWQSFYHEENLKVFDERPFVWCTFVWNMFDFGSQFRREGDHYGINDKGLVTFDRKHKKDAYYFYKANWSTQPVLHITSADFIFRKKDVTDVKVYTNLPKVSLSVNGKSWESKSPDKGIVVWKNIGLKQGNNGIIVKGSKDGNDYTDDCVWVVEGPFSGVNLVINIMNLIRMAHLLAAGFVVTALLIWLLGIRRLNKRRKGMRRLLYFFFYLLLVCSAILLVGQYFVTHMVGG